MMDGQMDDANGQTDFARCIDVPELHTGHLIITWHEVGILI